MPFISAKDNREMEQGFFQYTPVKEASFGEVFAASVGSVFDENLSVSGGLNRQGWRERESMVRSILASNDSFNRKDYIDRRGRFDYDRFAEDSGDERVKTDSQLNEERMALLQSRREYSEDVIERGSGMAQFLGMATAFILDPINLATMGAGSSVSASKATTTIGKAMLGARDAALISGATELAIQPMVYAHKSDIDSPYAASDAIEALASASVGGGLIGAFTGGISGMLRSTREMAESLPETDDILQAKDSLMRMEQTLKNAPEKTADGEASFLRQLGDQKLLSDQPSKTPEQYGLFGDQPKADEVQVVNEVVVGEQDIFPTSIAKGRQSEILNDLGLKEDFDLDMQSYNLLEDPIAIRDGDPIPASEVMKSLDDEMSGIDSILVCARG